MEYVVVEFPDKRDVFVDDVETPVAVTNELFEVEEGTHCFKLGGPKDYQPEVYCGLVTGTIPANPMIVVFTKTP